MKEEVVLARGEAVAIPVVLRRRECRDSWLSLSCAAETTITEHSCHVHSSSKTMANNESQQVLLSHHH